MRLHPLVPPPDPLELAAHVAARPYPVLLHGAAHHHDLGRWSYLAWDPVVTLRATPEEWPAVAARVRATLGAAPRPSHAPPLAGGWIGWLGYELGRAFDRQPVPRHDPFGVPAVGLALYDTLVAWDHHANLAWVVSSGVAADGTCNEARADSRLATRLAELAAPPAPPISTPSPPREGAAARHAAPPFPGAPDGLGADFAEATYAAAVARVVEAITAGDLFQANLSQRFTAPWTAPALALYRRVHARTPAALGAWLDDGVTAIASVSPELFLRFDPATREVETRPIKGTRPRDPDPVRDAALARELLGSEKDVAENVMITDLLRNDLARVAEPGSVRVPVLAGLESYPAVHHLVSTIAARVADGVDALDLLAATFPGGSITGAPKVRAMELIAELEPVARGPYCGAIGWIGLDGAMVLNVAIRTIVLAGGLAAVHAGGGITARSDPAAEHLETLDKARALVAALGEAP